MTFHSYVKLPEGKSPLVLTVKSQVFIYYINPKFPHSLMGTSPLEWIFPMIWWAPCFNHITMRPVGLQVFVSGAESPWQIWSTSRPRRQRWWSQRNQPPGPQLRAGANNLPMSHLPWLCWIIRGCINKHTDMLYCSGQVIYTLAINRAPEYYRNIIYEYASRGSFFCMGGRSRMQSPASLASLIRLKNIIHKACGKTHFLC